MSEETVNIANSITFIRLLIGLSLPYFIITGDTIFALIAYSTFVLLDMLDGFAARKFDCETTFGKNFDFFVDGFGGTITIIALIISGILPLITFLLIALPMTIKSIFIARHFDKTFKPARWRKLNGIILFMFPLMYIINIPITIWFSYLLIILIWVTSIKYCFEVRWN